MLQGSGLMAMQFWTPTRLTHNVVTERNILAVTDFLADGRPCAPGQGCRLVVVDHSGGEAGGRGGGRWICWVKYTLECAEVTER